VNSSSSNGISFINSTFERIEGISFEAPCIEIGIPYSSVNITLSLFKDIHCIYDTVGAAAVYYNMHTINGDYKFAGNTFFNISSPHSAVVLHGNFTSLLFENNSFIDVTVLHEGGVLS
jgi:hypothetical protein